jgi:hypothetical protein
VGKFFGSGGKEWYFGASVVGLFIVRNKFVSSLCMGPQKLCDPAQLAKILKNTQKEAISWVG